MLYISREKFQLLPEKKILKQADYCAYLEAQKAIQHAYSENDHLIQHASQLCEKLVNDTNSQIAYFIADANSKANEVIDSANQNAAQIIDEANAKSKAILDEALHKRTQIFEEAKKYYEGEAKRGYDDGYATGKAELSQKLAELTVKNKENICYLESSVVGLVLKVLQRVIGDFDKKELIVSIVRQALKMVKNQQDAVLKVSPQDSQAVRDHLQEILSDGVVDYLEVIADSRLNPGTCILETDVGVIDASLDIQLEAITNAFKKITNQSDDAPENTEVTETNDQENNMVIEESPTAPIPEESNEIQQE
ncbi:MAG: HrpE/YscL family type III secretion apparatus protein [Puniceicoccales bacterium]|jgi:type III secretion protein L|nr:HrpE/YscL family type III secretion apparatus protein [Puniceicoccales bacterium]